MFVRYRPTQGWSAVSRRVCFYGLILPATLLGTVACKDILVDFPPPGQGCEDGDLHDIRCGINGAGAQRQECTASVWVDVGPCSDPDVCVNGDEKQEECGENLLGRVTHICERGQWTDSDECVVPPTDTACDDGDHRHLPCGLNDEGLLLQECVADAWQDVGQCSGHDVCKNGDSSLQACGADGLGLADNLCENGQWKKVGDCHLAADSIAVGAEHLCLLSKTEKAYCWGENKEGQSGAAGVDVQATPAHVDLPDPVAQIVAGMNHSCARTSRGDVYCWGQNDHFQLGAPSTIPHSSAPIRVSDIHTSPETAAVGLSAGHDHTCAVLKSGHLQCWGRNDVAQLGANLPSDIETHHLGILVPFINPDTTTLRSVALGENHSCALVDDGEVWCWGIDGSANDTPVPSGSFVRIAAPDGAPLKATLITAGYDSSYAATSIGRVYGWGGDWLGSDDSGDPGIAEALLHVDASNPVVGLSRGRHSSCALRQAGDLQCWGYNSLGAVGVPGDDIYVITPREVRTPSATLASVQSKESTPCALTEEGLLVCWGYNEIRENTYILFTEEHLVREPHFVRHN